MSNFHRASDSIASRRLLLTRFDANPAVKANTLADVVGRSSQFVRPRLRRLDDAGIIETATTRPLRFRLTARGVSLLELDKNRCPPGPRRTDPSAVKGAVEMIHRSLTPIWPDSDLGHRSSVPTSTSKHLRVLHIPGIAAIFLLILWSPPALLVELQISDEAGYPRPCRRVPSRRSRATTDKTSDSSHSSITSW